MERIILSAFDSKEIGKVHTVDAAAADSMLAKAYACFKDRSQWLKHHERIQILNKLADLVASEANFFATTLAQESGKPITDTRVEVSRAIDGIKLATKELMTTFKGEEIPMGFNKPSENRLAFTIKQPCGVVLSISAYNHPLNLAVHQIIPAIAVGCPVIIKPSSRTPLCCSKLVELVHKSGLPKDWCQVVICDNQVAEQLVSDPRISFFSFIGSAKIGWYLRNRLAPGTRYTLEHGGAAPVIIDNTIKNIDEIVQLLAKGGFYHAGQVCISTQRVFAHKSIIDQVADKLTSTAKKLRVGDPVSDQTDVGPIISASEVQRIDNWVQEAVKEGAKLLCGGTKITDTTYSPTVLLKPSDNSKVSVEEIFGPVICIYEYEKLSEAIDRANAPNLPFQSAVFSNDLDNVMKVIYNIDTAAVVVNDHSAFRVDWMPFSGRGISGAGTGGIGYSMHELTNYKLAIIKSMSIYN